MKDFTTSLLREKFVIRDKNGNELVATSNRMYIEFTDFRGALAESFVIRAQNMHSTVRVAARLIRDYEQEGPILKRNISYNWEEIWNTIINEYEYHHNPDRWVAVYSKGKCVFHQGEHNLFLDMIEKCDAENDKAYEASIPQAESLLKATGKEVKITYDANVALNVQAEPDHVRCGIILRGPNRTTTFSITSHIQGSQKKINTSQCLAAAAAYLEGLQLAFRLGFDTVKLRLGIYQHLSKEEKQTREGSHRLVKLRSEITALEDIFDVRYRPEKPEFAYFLSEAEDIAQKTIKPPSPEELQKLAVEQIERQKEKREHDLSQSS